MDNFKLHYRGSLFWLIFWLIVFFPIAFVLLLTGSSFEFNDTTYIIEYDGSRFWLGFWVLVFFPVAFILLLVNGLKMSQFQKKVNPPEPPSTQDPLDQPKNL